MSARREDARFLRAVARKQWGPLTLSALGAGTRQMGFLATPVLLSLAIDKGVLASNAAGTAWWCAAVIAAAIVQFLGLCVWEQFSNLADARAGAWIRSRVRERVLAKRGGVDGVGEVISQAGRDVDLIRVWVHGLPTWVVIALTVAVLVPGLANLDPWLLLVAATTAPVLAVLSVLYPRRFERAATEAARAHGRRAESVADLVRGAVSLRGMGEEAVAVRQHAAVSEAAATHTIRSSRLLGQWMALGEGVPAIATAVGVLLGALAALDGRLSPGGIVTFSGWMATVGIAVQVGLMRYSQAVEARVGARRLRSALPGEDVARPAGERVSSVRRHVASEPVPSPDLAEPGRNNGRGLRLEGAELYAEAPQRSFDFPQQGLVAVTGPVGSGKTTLLGLLAEEARGRSRMRWVPQRPLIVTGTLRENLELGHVTGERAQDDAIYARALAAVGLPTELEHRAERDVLDLPLGEAGGELSGGQRQRLALARALVASPSVLLVDDVTSAVDPATSRRIVRTLRAAADAGALVVATGHDAELIDRADAVFVLEGPGRTKPGENQATRREQ